MGNGRRLALVTAIVTLSMVAPALAETPGTWAICRDNAAPSRDVQIAACTAVIGWHHLAKAELAAAYYFRGHAYSEKNWPVRARIDFERALTLRPNYPEALVGRGEILTQRNKWREAIWDYDRAIRLKPGFADAYVDRGIALDTLHQFDRAIADFDRALTLRPNDPSLEALREGARRATGEARTPDTIARAKEPHETPPAALEP